jgi:hypothetical protein
MKNGKGRIEPYGNQEKGKEENQQEALSWRSKGNHGDANSVPKVFAQDLNSYAVLAAAAPR